MMRTKFTVHLSPTFAMEVKEAARGCGLPPSQYIAQAVGGFFASQRIARWEFGEEVKLPRPRLPRPSIPR